MRDLIVVLSAIGGFLVGQEHEWQWLAGIIICTAKLDCVGEVIRHGAPLGVPCAYIRVESFIKANLELEIDPYGDYRIGRYIWMLTKARKFAEPYPISGHQRIWYWETTPELPRHHIEDV